MDRASNPAEAETEPKWLSPLSFFCGVVSLAQVACGGGSSGPCRLHKIFYMNTTNVILRELPRTNNGYVVG